MASLLLNLKSVTKNKIFPLSILSSSSQNLKLNIQYEMSVLERSWANVSYTF